MSGGARPTAAIVSVGNELLFGETVDTNAAWLGRTLSGYGIRVVRRYTVGDVDEHIEDALRLALDAADLVIVAGGLGPTPDDRTKGVVARHLRRALVVDEGVHERVSRHFRAAGYDEIPTLSRGQAEIPEGARALENPSGTAPGLLIEGGTVTVVLLPGVPRELRDIVSGDLDPVLRAFGARAGERRIHHRLVHTTGIAETSLAERIEAELASLDHEVTEGIDVAYLPDLRGVDLRFTIEGGSEEEASRRFGRLLSALDDVLGAWRFEAESGDIAEAVTAQLRSRGWTLAVAESCTGGLLGARMTEWPGASDVFAGGVIAYADAAKVEHVGVPRELLERDGAVSESVARALASGAAQRFGTDVGVGVTGVAGPGGATKGKPVGTVWIGLSVDGDVDARRSNFAGDRGGVRERSAQAALAWLYRRLEAGPRQD